MKKYNLKRIVLLSLFSALFAVAEIYSPKIGNFKISLSAIVIIVIAILYGSLDSLIVSFIGGIVSQIVVTKMMNYTFGPTMLLWILPGCARALIISLFIYNIDFKKYKLKYILVIIISSIIVTILNTLVQWIDCLVYHYDSELLILTTFLYRVLLGIISSIIYILIVPLVVIPLRKFLNIN